MLVGGLMLVYVVFYLLLGVIAGCFCFGVGFGCLCVFDLVVVDLVFWRLGVVFLVVWGGGCCLLMR